MKRIWAIVLVIALCVAGCTQPMEARAATVEDDPIVIVLDPGHGGYDGGATRTWSGKTYREKTLNLAIAQYCKAELEKYAGVEVYLTRSDDTYVSLQGRVVYADKLGADLFVSLHNNASTSSSCRGACVYYPNSNYDSEIGAEGKSIAESIEKQLTGLGLKNNGIAYRNSETHTKYPNQTLADYYQVIKLSKLCGFPGLIVEHAYVSNASDCSTFFSTQEKLKKLGIADATGIANYFGLAKVGTPTLTGASNQSDGSVALSWVTVSGADGYAVYRRKSGASTFKQIATVKGASTNGYTDTSTSGGTTYVYAIRAYATNKKVTRYTEYSNALEAASLAAPANVSAKQMSGGRIKVVWDSVSGASGYQVMRRTNTSESYTVVADISGGGTLAWEDEDTQVGTTYRYCVYSYAASGKSKTSDTVKVTLEEEEQLLSAEAQEAEATEVTTVDGVAYELAETATVLSYQGTQTTLSLPESVEGVPVTAIAQQAFYDCYLLETVKLPETVTYIGEEAFAECSSLTKLVVCAADSVTVEEDAFACSGHLVLYGYTSSGAKSAAAAAGIAYKQIKDYTVSYQLSGGTNNSANPAQYSNYEGAVKLAEPTRKGYTFAGWYTSEDGTTAVTSLQKAASGSGEITLYALWYQTPDTVSLKKAQSSKTGQIQVTWSSTDTADGYVIYRKLEGGAWKKVATVKSSSKNSYTDKDVMSEYTYYYTVKAYTKVGGKTYYGSKSTSVKAVCK